MPSAPKAASCTCTSKGTAGTGSSTPGRFGLTAAEVQTIFPKKTFAPVAFA
jgi:hypothetical protein